MRCSITWRAGLYQFSRKKVFQVSKPMTTIDGAAVMIDDLQKAVIGIEDCAVIIGGEDGDRYTVELQSTPTPSASGAHRSATLRMGSSDRRTHVHNPML